MNLCRREKDFRLEMARVPRSDVVTNVVVLGFG